MYALPQDEVRECLAACGAELLSVERGEYDAFENLTYIARKAGGQTH